MNLLFYAVYKFLMTIASWTGLSYEAVNIIVYYVLIPFIFLALIDRILRRHICIISFGIALFVSLLVIRNPSSFCDELFDLSVRFLESFSQIGLGYCGASVVVCVIVPLVIFATLFYFAYPNFIARQFPTLNKLVKSPSQKRATKLPGG